MTHQEILTKAIQKAIDNGFGLLSRQGLHVTSWDVAARGPRGIEPYVRQYSSNKIFMREIPWQVVIFHHDFAKALWGTQEGYELCGSWGNGEMWQCRLQEMVIAEDPLAYLGEHLDY